MGVLILTSGEVSEIGYGAGGLKVDSYYKNNIWQLNVSRGQTN
jgi:hypothetical protein